MTDDGINDDFMKKVGAVLKPGQAALFMLVRQHASDKVIERLGQNGGRLIRTNLDTAKEAEVRAALDKARLAASQATGSNAAA